MSSAERFVRHHSRQTDRAISQAYARLRPEAAAWSSFDCLLTVARRRAPGLLRAPIAGDPHPGIAALEELARAADRHVRPASTWAGSDAGWQGAVAALAQHLIGAYPVPAFLGAAWYAAAADPYAAAQRAWYVGHGAGRSFRSLDLPVRLTRRMEHLLLKSPPHLGVARALRRAELLALGAEEAFAAAILQTQPALNLDHGDFWRTAWIFLIANARTIRPDQLAPIVDFLDGVRHECIEVETPAGTERRGPPEPDFSLKGRTVASVLRRMEEWHRALGRTASAARWTPSPLKPMRVEMPAEDPRLPPVEWLLVELTSAAELRSEGAALGHCVASYSRRCATGASRIWSLRRKRGGQPPRSILTVEVDPWRQAIVQVRGRWNRWPDGRPLQIVRSWAARERLRVIRV